MRVIDLTLPVPAAERGHPTLRELMRALAEGLLAPARALVGLEPHDANRDA